MKGGIIFYICILCIMSVLLHQLQTRGHVVKFTVPEEEEPPYLVGRVEAEDPDAGRNGRIFYYILR